MYRIFACSLAFFVCTPVVGGTLRLTGVVPTPLVSQGMPPRQKVLLTIKNDGPGSDCRLRVSSEKRLLGEVALGSVATGTTEHAVMLPEPTSTRPSRWTLVDATGQLLAEQEILWQPPRHWTLYVLKSAHIDIGLHAEQYRQRDLVVRAIDDARKLADETANWPDASKFRFVVEHLWWLLNYPADRPEIEMDRLVNDYIKPGRIGIGAGHSGNHTQEFGTEELCRSMYYAQEVRDRWKLPANAAIYADINGISWPMVTACADAGIRYLALLPNAWRTRMMVGFESKPPHVFYWQGPDGHSRVLVWTGPHYISTGSAFGIRTCRDRTKAITTPQTLEEPLTRRLQQLESRYPYDVWLISNYDDNEPPNLRAATLAKDWNAKWRWPQLRTVGDLAQPFREVEERFAGKIPTLSGDITPGWAQHPVSTPVYLGRKRAADRLLPTAEVLATLARLNIPTFVYPTRELRGAWDALVCSDEHGYGVSGYKGKPVYVTWAHKRGWIDRGLSVARRQSQRALQALADCIPTKGPAVVVFNPLLHQRTDLVTAVLPASLEGTFAVRCPETGKPLPVERDGRQLHFVAADVPSLGYKTFPLEPATAAPQTEKAASGQGTKPPVLENGSYRVTFASDGSIRSIVDKRLKRELLDLAAPHRGNQFVCTADDHKTFVTPGPATFTREDTPLRQSVVARMDEPVSGARICQRVTLPRHESRIDLDNRLEHVAGISKHDRYQFYGYYAFPLAVPEGTIRAQLNGCVARPYHDQTPVGVHDWLAVQDWVDVSNRQYGVTWCQRESHLVEFGAIRTNKHSNDYRPRNGWLYSYLFNNWYQKNFTSRRDTCMRYQYSIRGHSGDHRSGGADRFGRRFGSPLLAEVRRGPQPGHLPAGHCSFLEVDVANVELLTLKLSEAPGQGVVARLHETAGLASGPVAVRLRGAEEWAWTDCSMTEQNRQRLAQPGGVLRPFGIATLRAESAGAMSKVTGLAVKTVSDKSLRLSWPASPGAAQYYVYRGSKAGCTADVYHLAAVTTEPSYQDDWLNRGTSYCYRVAAADKANMQGPASAPVTARTAATGNSPPAPVGYHDNGLVSAGCAWRGDRSNTLHVLWGQNREPDLAHYQLYRGRTPDFAASAKTLVADVPPGPFVVVSYDDTGLEPDTTYYYRVRAIDKDGNASSITAAWSATTRE